MYVSIIVSLFTGVEPKPVPPLELVREPEPHRLHCRQVPDMAQQGQTETLRIPR